MISAICFGVAALFQAAAAVFYSKAGDMVAAALSIVVAMLFTAACVLTAMPQL